jgi:heme exporter protein D
VIVNLGPHAAFIVTAYIAATAIVAGLIGWIVLDRRRLSRILDDFDAQGISRRSTRADADKW